MALGPCRIECSMKKQYNDDAKFAGVFTQYTRKITMKPEDVSEKMGEHRDPVKSIWPSFWHLSDSTVIIKLHEET